MLKLGRIEGKYLKFKDFFEESLGSYLSEQCKESDLSSIFDYSLIDAGKRFRPVLSLSFAEVLGIPSQKIIRFCIAVELLHNSSLIHDDLPALDDDSIRRGKDTVHVSFGEANAVLAADALISMAFKCLSEAEEVSSEVIVYWVRELSEAFTKLCHGQSLDISEMNSIDDSKNFPQFEIEKRIEKRHKLKTGALIKSCVVAPAILYNSDLYSSEQKLEPFSQFAENLGLLFQITDDIEDALELKGHLDEHNEQATYVSLYGVDGAREKAFDVADEAIKILKTLGDENAYDVSFLISLTEAIRDRA